jgi:putative redox protein
MQATLVYQEGASISQMYLVGTNEAGKQTAFDVRPEHGGGGLAASPMEVLMQAAAACSSVDVLSILRKKRKTVTNLRVEMQGERAAEHPRVFTDIAFTFILTSPDAELKDLERSVELSETTYCSAMAMLRRSGCNLTFSCQVVRP